MKRWLLVALAVLAASLALPAIASGATRHDAYPLHAGSTGPRVAGLQWMLSGHRPNVFRQVKPTLHHYTPGVFGARTKAAVVAYKFRLGYPPKLIRPVAGRYFIALLRGKPRPVAWVALAQKRLKAVVPGASPLALKIKAVEVSQLGVSENTGYNRGTTVDAYSRYFGLPLGLAWCEIFQQWSFAHAGYRPPFADRSFAVFYTVEWARQHGFLNAKAKVGALVAFLGDQGHIGYVVKVLASGYVTVEGNSSNRVQQVYHPWNDRLRVFIWLPGVA